MRENKLNWPIDHTMTTLITSGLRNKLHWAVYHSSTQRRQQLQDWQEALSPIGKTVWMQRSTQRVNITDWFLVPTLVWCCHLPVREHSALILESEKDSRGVQRAAFNVRTVVPYLEYYHRKPIHNGNVVTSGTSIFGIYQHTIPNRSKRKQFSSEISGEFPKKTRWNINYV